MAEDSDDIIQIGDKSAAPGLEGGSSKSGQEKEGGPALGPTPLDVGEHWSGPSDDLLDHSVAGRGRFPVKAVAIGLTVIVLVVVIASLAFRDDKTSPAPSPTTAVGPPSIVSLGTSTAEKSAAEQPSLPWPETAPPIESQPVEEEQYVPQPSHFGQWDFAPSVSQQESSSGVMYGAPEVGTGSGFAPPVDNSEADLMVEALSVEAHQDIEILPGSESGLAPEKSETNQAAKPSVQIVIGSESSSAGGELNSGGEADYSSVSEQLGLSRPALVTNLIPSDEISSEIIWVDPNASVEVAESTSGRPDADSWPVADETVDNSETAAESLSLESAALGGEASGPTGSPRADGITQSTELVSQTADESPQTTESGSEQTDSSVAPASPSPAQSTPPTSIPAAAAPAQAKPLASTPVATVPTPANPPAAVPAQSAPQAATPAADSTESQISELWVANIFSSPSQTEADKVWGRLTSLSNADQLYRYETTVDGQKQYRIRVGFFPDRAAAEAVGQGLASAAGVGVPWTVRPNVAEVKRFRTAPLSSMWAVNLSSTPDEAESMAVWEALGQPKAIEVLKELSGRKAAGLTDLNLYRYQTTIDGKKQYRIRLGFFQSGQTALEAGQTLVEAAALSSSRIGRPWAVRPTLAEEIDNKK
ncbi:MAG: SPOR domain-containing protein [Deltaproteobacteria bacterium]|jgi:septal ring-binding cell division protein DamX|nr:SPOR domain-containing protein [Deltaproteobacteria bacterium]